MSKSTKTKSGAASSAVTDIPHEEVKNSENGISHVPKIITAEDQLKIEIAKFDIAESGIALLKEKYGGLTIAGVDDKDGYKKTREAWSEVRSNRTKFEKKGLELRGGYGIITKGIKKYEDGLVELITPLEEDLYQKWKAIDDEKDRAKAEALAAEEAELNKKLDELIAMGMEFKGGFWQLGETISIDVATLRAMAPEQYEGLKRAVKAKADEIAADKLKQDQEAEKERQRVQKEKDDLAQQQREMKEQREKFEREKEELAKAQREAQNQKIENRLNKLIGLGMVKRDFDLKFDNGFQSFTDSILEISEMSDAEFDGVYNANADQIKQMNVLKAEDEERVNQEKAAKAEKEKVIAGKMLSAGLTYDYNSQAFHFKNEVLTISVGWNFLLAMSEDDINHESNYYCEQIKAARIEVEKLENDRKAAADKEARLAMTDKDLFAKTVQLVRETLEVAIKPEEYKTKKYQQLAQTFKTTIEKILNELK